LRIPQFLIGVALSGYRSAILPACAGDLPFSLAFRSAATCAACRSPALPSNSTSDSHRLPDSLASFPINLQLALSTDLSAQLSSQSSTCVSD